jgi:GntR family transcriptional regulator
MGREVGSAKMKPDDEIESRVMLPQRAAYLEIAEALRKEILSEGRKPHTRLPSEPELVRRFGMARETIRRALAKLQSEKLIYSRQGVGSFVTEPRVEQDLDELLSFTAFMVYRGIKAGSSLLTANTQRLREPDSPVLRHLGLRPGAHVIHLRRVRTGGGEPLVIANTWLPAALFKGFLKQDLERRSVYDLMASMGHRPTDAVQTIEAVGLGPDEARLLTVQPGSPALLVHRLAYAGAVAVEYAEDYYRGDRTRFRVRLGVLEHGLAEKERHEHIAL